MVVFGMLPSDTAPANRVVSVLAMLAGSARMSGDVSTLFLLSLFEEYVAKASTFVRSRMSRWCTC